MTPMFLDIGTGELLAIAVLAAILLGPERVPELAKKAGRVITFLRGIANNATDQIKAELGPEIAELHLDELHLDDLKPRNLVARALPGDVSAEMDSLRAELTAMRSEVARLNGQGLKGVATLVAGDAEASAPTPDAASTPVAQPAEPAPPARTPVTDASDIGLSQPGTWLTSNAHVPEMEHSESGAAR